MTSAAGIKTTPTPLKKEVEDPLTPLFDRLAVSKVPCLDKS